MAPFPLVKLAIVFLKQISKPLANQIKTRAKSSEFFKKYICMPPAQFYHWYDVNLRMRMLGIETKQVAKMNEEAAVNLGADILGEAVILSIGIAGLMLEYARRSKNDSEKEARQLERLSNLEKSLAELEIQAANHAAQLLQLERQLHHQSPPSPKTKKSSPSTNEKSPAGQSFSILEKSSVSSSLMQLHPADLLLFPAAYAVQLSNSYMMSLQKQWTKVTSAKK